MLAAAPTVKIHREQVPVRAELTHLDALSGHADREELLARAGALPAPPQRICDTHVVGLRRKVERDPARPARILAVRGVGYKLVAA